MHTTFMAAVQMCRVSVTRRLTTFVNVYVIDAQATAEYIAKWRPNLTNRHAITLDAINFARSIHWDWFVNALQVRVTSNTEFELKSTGSMADLIETWDCVMLFHPDGKNASEEEGHRPFRESTLSLSLIHISEPTRPY